MDVRDRSTYTASLETAKIEAPTRLRAESHTAAAIGSPSTQDSTDLSPAARAAAQALALPDVRQERVSALQQQISSGAYHVAPQDVADALLRNLQG